MATESMAVMLCERPAPCLKAAVSEARPFLPSSGSATMEGIGVMTGRPPASKTARMIKAERSSFNRRHKRSIAALATRVKAAKQQQHQLMAAWASKVRGIRKAGLERTQDVLNTELASPVAEDSNAHDCTRECATHSVSAAAAASRQPYDQEQTLFYRLKDKPFNEEEQVPWRAEAGTDELDAASKDAAVKEMQELVQSALASASQRATNLAASSSMPAAIDKAGQAGLVISSKASPSSLQKETCAWGGGTTKTAAADVDGKAAAKAVGQDAGEARAPSGGVCGDAAAAASEPVAQVSAGPPCASKAPAAKRKPAWALSETEAGHAAVAEEAALLSFAEDLDLDATLHELADQELAAALQAAKEAQNADQIGDPAAWKASFVRAMNHLANCSARPAHQAAAAIGGSAAGESVAASHITEGTVASAARAQAAREQRAALQAKAEDPDWDRSTKVGHDDQGQAPIGGVSCAEEMLRENKALALVHSALSMKALISKKEAVLVAQSASATAV